jgi:hypothetical protein
MLTMATYSHSKISSFENFPFQYKLHYIDKIKPESETTIECFMGDLVHLVLISRAWNRILQKF